jgi:hypothetical protein
MRRCGSKWTTHATEPDRRSLAEQPLDGQGVDQPADELITYDGRPLPNAIRYCGLKMDLNVLRRALSTVEILLDSGRSYLILPQLQDAYLELGWLEWLDGKLVVSDAGRAVIKQQRGWHGKDPIR